MQRTQLSKLLSAISFALVAADIKFSMFGIPTALLCLFLAYAISWELAHLFRVKWNAYTSESSSTSISLILVGALFYFGCTDKAVATLIQTHGQNTVYGSIQWRLNELTLVALSMGMMMGALVLAATIVSYVVDAWSQRKPIMVVLGTASSVLVGLTVGIPFGLAVTMIAPKESALSLLSLIGGVSVANLLKADDEANSQSSQRYRFLSPIAGGLFSALVAGILINSMLESAKLFALVTFGVMAQQRLLSGLGIEQVPENVPKILSVGIGFYARHFLAIGVCASAAMLLKLL